MVSERELIEAGRDYSRGTVVVTGAGSGIGRAIGLAFAAAGARVVAADIDLSAVEETLRLTGDPERGIAVHCDVSDEASVTALSDQVAQRYGHADALINVAGVFDKYTPATELALDLWNRVVGINLTGQFLTSRALIPGMIAAGGGVIVNIASMCGLVAGAGGVAYTASKHGSVGLTRELAHEYGPSGIRVNAICPGVIAAGMTLPHIEASGGVADAATEGIAARRMGRADEVASLAVYLTGAGAAYIQGAALPVDGGWTAI
jgi:3-oxoacyl-[acyl-carrier protein] reductase